MREKLLAPNHVSFAAPGYEDFLAESLNHILPEMWNIDGKEVIRTIASQSMAVIRVGRLSEGGYVVTMTDFSEGWWEGEFLEEHFFPADQEKELIEWLCNQAGL
jgi:hypothetical protein